MNYKTQNKQPKELLTAVGFEEAPDRGMQIVIRPNSRKPCAYDYRTLIPISRLHATFFENQLNIHYDAGKKKSKKHRTFQRHDLVFEILEKIKQIDII